MKRALQLLLLVVAALLSLATSRAPQPRVASAVAVEPGEPDAPGRFSTPPPTVRYVSVPTEAGGVIVIRCDSPTAPAGCWQ